MAYFPHICPLLLSFSLLWSLYRLILFDVLLSYFPCSSLYNFYNVTSDSLNHFKHQRQLALQFNCEDNKIEQRYFMAVGN